MEESERIYKKMYGPAKKVKLCDECVMGGRAMDMANMKFGESMLISLYT